MMRGNTEEKKRKNWRKGTAIVFFCLSVFFTGILVNAVNTSAKEQRAVLYYTSVCIEKGDTLWGIAEEYAEDSGMSVREYFNKLKEINRISGEGLREGNYLTIAYAKPAE